jgi:hypothetical protein
MLRGEARSGRMRPAALSGFGASSERSRERPAPTTTTLATRRSRSECERLLGSQAVHLAAPDRLEVGSGYRHRMHAVTGRRPLPSTAPTLTGHYDGTSFFTFLIEDRSRTAYKRVIVVHAKPAVVLMTCQWPLRRTRRPRPDPRRVNRLTPDQAREWSSAPWLANSRYRLGRRRVRSQDVVSERGGSRGSYQRTDRFGDPSCPS